VTAAKLDKRTDFVGMSFAEMNLDGLELEGFDFSDADFRECSLKGTVFIECELKGAAFKFPPDVRDKWGRNPDIFLGTQPDDVLELMRSANEASRKEERKRAVEQLLQFRDDGEIGSFLEHVCLKDKAKSLRLWLRKRLAPAEAEGALRTLLERSLFEGGEDLDGDISEYLKITASDGVAIDLLCQACAANPRAIKRASVELARSDTFKRFLINCLSFSQSHQAWTEAASALTASDVSQWQKDRAFALRLSRIKDKHDLSHLAEHAAANGVRLPRLFELCEQGYQNELDRWGADDHLVYCYFYDNKKYLNDVLFHSFYKLLTNSDAYHSLAHGAFGAYCLVHRPDLYHAVKSVRGYFYVAPLELIGEGHLDDQRYPARVQDELKQLSRHAYEQALALRPEDPIIRRTDMGSL